MAETRRNALTNPERRLPNLSLPAPGGGTAAVLAPRRSTILVLVHGDACRACQEYLRLLEVLVPDAREWDGRLVTILPAPNPALEAPFDVVLLFDSESRVARTASAIPPAVLVVDQWREIREAFVAGPEHEFPDPAELADWLRFLAIQCPECEGEAM